MTKIKLDCGAEKIMSVLENNGYQAYAVGGCVRDSILGKNPDDWDITTSAKPEKTAEIFSKRGYSVIPTGIKHGTVTVRVDGKNYEVTTFRCDGEYSDCRRPEKVEFVTNLEEDLKRRDFTINALAYSEKSGLIDLYGGLSDINNKIIRTVGNPKERFTEDALRILRGARFCSQLGFSIESKTLQEMENLSENLKKVSVERIFVEISKLLVGQDVRQALTSCKKIIFTIIPELACCDGFEQHSLWHKYDVYTHTVEAVANVENDLALRFTMLLHDVGKPEKFFMRGNVGHFYGHAIKSYDIAQEVLRRLKAPTQFTKDVLFLVKNHDKQIGFSRAKVKKALNEMGENAFFNLIKVKRADNKAQATDLANKESENIEKLNLIAEEIIRSGECYSLKTLEIDGSDLEKLGFSGKNIGRVLDDVLQKVIRQELENDRAKIISYLNKN